MNKKLAAGIIQGLTGVFNPFGPISKAWPSQTR